VRGRWWCCCTGFPEFWYGWREQIGPLAAGFCVVAPDTRGYKLSPTPDGVHAYDTRLLAADIAGLIRERGAGSAMLAGHDWGGSVAWATAMACPEVVDRLAILNAAHPRKLAQGLHHPERLRKSWYFFFFFFDLPDLPETVVHAGQQALAASMRAAWANFAATGRPATAAVPWPAFGAGSARMLSLVPPQPQLETDFATRHHCAFWAAG
jgi:pimeloyl-ACP methyl ester carboxylesterase